MNSAILISDLPQPGLARLYSLGAIVLAHAGLLYALQNGLMSQAVQFLPKEVVMTFVVAEQAKPEPPKQQTPPVKQYHLTPPVVAIPREVILQAEPTPAPTITATAVEAPVAIKSEVPAPVKAIAAMPKVVSAIEYVRPPQPDYPSLSRRLGEEGRVILRVLVNEKGHAEKVEVHHSSGSQRLDDAARQAIMRAIFKPYIEDGKALPIIATATISFSLDA